MDYGRGFCLPSFSDFQDEVAKHGHAVNFAPTTY
jgi:hypothetical protein